MNILAIGNKKRIQEFKDRLAADIPEVEPDINNWNINYGTIEDVSKDQYDLIIDFNFDDDFDSKQKIEEKLAIYSAVKDSILVLSAVKLELRSVLAHSAHKLQCPVAGVNALPTFINKPLWETSLVFEKDAAKVEETLGKLGIKIKKVADRVGMITPRVILMIINEAFYTVQEGTATKKDIDSAMKLGTNYPHGPFEWADKIGINNVYQTLLALGQDTQDDRYKICPLLKSTYHESLILLKQA